MAKDKKEKEQPNIMKDLIKQVNKESNTPFAYAMEDMDSPAHIKEWLSVGIKVLDAMVSNSRNGCLPCGRIVELSGMNSSGKTLVAMCAAREVQKDGGYVIWIDHENSFSETLSDLIKLKTATEHGFAYFQPPTISETFHLVEKSLIKLRQTNSDKKLLIVWDSLAASTPATILENDYGQQTMGLAAREVSQGLSKIKNIIGRTNAYFLITNQLRKIIARPGEIVTDPFTTPHGMALDYYASIRLRMFMAGKIKNKDKQVIGNKVRVKLNKSRFGPAFRECEFNMLYTKGIDEYDSVIDVLVDSKFISKSGGWYYCDVADKINKEEKEKSYRKEDIIQLLKTNKEFEQIAMDSFYDIMIQKYEDDDIATIEDETGNVKDAKNGTVLYNSKDKELLDLKLGEDNEIIEEEDK